VAEHQCLMLEDGIYHSEQWLIARNDLLTDAGSAVEAYSFGLSVSLRDSAMVLESYIGIRTLGLAEAGVWQEVYRPVALPEALLLDRGRIGERWMTRRSVTMSDAGAWGESYGGNSRLAVQERGAFSEQYVPTGSPSAMLSDIAKGGERYSSARTGALAELGHWGELFTAARSALLADAGRLGEILSAEANAIVFIRERGVLADQFTGIGRPRGLLVDAGWGDERYLPSPPMPAGDGHTARRVGMTTGWTANTDTWAMSRYTDLPMNSLAVIDGVLYGAGDAGLFRLEGENDFGLPINAHVRTGKQALTGEQTATMRTVYAGATTDGRLQLTVDAAPKGVPVFYTYDFEPRLAEDLAPQRAKLGRGLKSRYWQATIGNKAGADFTIDSVSVLDSAGQRRV